MDDKETIDPRIIGIALIVIAGLMLSFATITRDKYTPQEYLNELRVKDSIELTQRKEFFVTEYVNEKIRANKNIKGVIEKVYYDNDMQAWEVSYSYAKNSDLDEYGKTLGSKIIEKVVWIKLNFIYNDGDYIIKPEIIKTGRRKQPTFVHPHNVIDVEYSCRKTYGK